METITRQKIVKNLKIADAFITKLQKVMMSILAVSLIIYVLWSYLAPGYVISIDTDKLMILGTGLIEAIIVAAFLLSGGYILWRIFDQ
jgi:hypothetical protein